MEIDSQVAAVRAAQGTLPVEQRMVEEAFAGPPGRTPPLNEAASWRRTALFDHGYAFALPGAILNYSDFVVARHENGAAGLRAEERAALTRLLSDPHLLGLARFLQTDRADALAARADEMLKRGEILSPGEF
jgi:hypothetical protein